MKNISQYLIAFVTILFLSCSNSNEQVTDENIIKPFGVDEYEEFENDSNHKETKEEYWNDIYQTSGDERIDSILYFQSKAKRTSSKRIRALNSVIGTWHERGSTNEAGDVREVDYEDSDNSLYIMSSVGHIWKGNLDKRKWQLINDKIKFNNNILKHVKKGNVDRLIAIYGDGKENKVPRYSDDNGLTWIKGSNIESSFHDHWGSPKKLYKLSDDKTLYYFVHTWKTSPWGSAFEVHKSIDYGETWNVILSLNGGSYNNGNSVSIGKSVNDDEIYVLDKVTNIMHVISHNFSNGNALVTTKNMSGTTLSSTQATLLTVKTINNETSFYAITNKTNVTKGVYNDSNDIVWSSIGSLGDNGAGNIFRNAWLVNPHTNQLFAGGFQLYISSDEGSTWTDKYSQWWEYYKVKNGIQQQDSMHVDIMDMAYFEKSDNTPFFIILNHAGIHVSYDNLSSTENLGLDGLNIITLYDQETAEDGTLYFGAQDKGTFRNLSNINLNTDQISSQNFSTGDGMRSLFFNNDQSWFGFLQNGFMYCSWDKSGTNKRSWNVPGNNTTGWINPIAHYHDPSTKKCYIAGGDINPNDANGEDGCHLITMEVSWDNNGSNFQWLPTQFDYDFRANSNSGNSVIKSISATPLDPNRIYVATLDATFFYTKDGGNTWSKSSTSLPSSLKCFDIEVSNFNEDVVYVSGNGFSNPAVYKSIDGGDTFEALDNNIPLATFESIALSPDDNFLFGASTNGPYLYDVENDTWEDLSDANTPIVTHNSVQYIKSINTVRFGTYGRGVWDFVLDNQITSTDNLTTSSQVSIYPNPVLSNSVHVTATNAKTISIYDLKGVLLKEVNATNTLTKVELSNFEKGTYLIRVELDDATFASDKLIIE